MQSRVRVFGESEYGADTAAGLPSVPTAADKSQALARLRGAVARAKDHQRHRFQGDRHSGTKQGKPNDKNPAFLRRSGPEVEGLPRALMSWRCI